MPDLNSKNTPPYIIGSGAREEKGNEKLMAEVTARLKDQQRMDIEKLDLSRVQRRLDVWQRTQFPKTRPMSEYEQHVMRMALGMNEEAGEIAHHVLKGAQGIRGGVGQYNIAEIVDGVCDCYIFGMQLLTALGVDVEEALEKTFREVIARDFINFPKNGVNE
jgi:NTP pyrophosphatase (non-canonical NTP hydrolase)